MFRATEVGGGRMAPHEDFSWPPGGSIAPFPRGSGGHLPRCCWPPVSQFLCCPRNQVLGAWAWLVPLAVALATFGSVNGLFFSGSRVCYVAAREGHMVRDGVGSGLGKVVGAAGGRLERSFRFLEAWHLAPVRTFPKDMAPFSSKNGTQASVTLH